MQHNERNFDAAVIRIRNFLCDTGG